MNALPEFLSSHKVFQHPYYTGTFLIGEGVKGFFNLTGARDIINYGSGADNGIEVKNRVKFARDKLSIHVPIRVVIGHPLVLYIGGKPFVKPKSV